ncbi:MAG: hypothetical protein CVT64_10595 [Actinobacteria bacterium HGW-Actinobacteria-4]|nr:MAG: hypothetical protein CVT64_10595 [Actinobacteria bacterium HGW-Actinobacteria-4]
MTDKAWRPPTAAERSLVESWVEAWNAQVGDTAVAGPDLVARTSCNCGDCPSFAVKPLHLDPERSKDRLLAVGGPANGRDGSAVAGLIAWKLMPGEVDFEIYTLANGRVDLENITIKFEATSD